MQIITKTHTGCCVWATKRQTSEYSDHKSICKPRQWQEVQRESIFMYELIYTHTNISNQKAVQRIGHSSLVCNQKANEING